MAGVIPMSRPPAYADAFVQQMQGIDLGAQKRLSSMLDANAASLGHILGNVKDIASVGGGAQVLDPLLRAYAGAKDDDVFNNPHTSEMDKLNLAFREAEIGAKQREHVPKPKSSGGGNSAMWKTLGQMFGATQKGAGTDPNSFTFDYVDANGNRIGTITHSVENIPLLEEQLNKQHGPGGRLVPVFPGTTPDVTSVTDESLTPVVTSGGNLDATPLQPAMEQEMRGAQPAPAPAPAAAPAADPVPSAVIDPALTGDPDALDFARIPGVTAVKPRPGGGYFVTQNGVEKEVD